MNIVDGAALAAQEVEARYRQRTALSRARHAEAQLYLPGGETRSSTWYAPYPTYMVSRRRRLAH